MPLQTVLLDIILEKIKLDWQADDSNEMSSFIFSEKKMKTKNRLSSAAAVIST